MKRFTIVILAMLALIFLAVLNLREKRIFKVVLETIGISGMYSLPMGAPCSNNFRLSKPMYFSQSREDFALFTHIFSKPYLQCYGTYLEIGALDGVTYSNTLFYEQSLNWTGILIEAEPANYARLKVNRPRNVLFGEAVCKQEKGGTLRFAGANAVGGVFDEVSDFHKKAYFKHNDPNKTVAVPCRPLSQMLHQAGITSIDIFSLDVEGSEYFVLETMDWNIPVRVFVMEYAEEPKYIKAHQLLLEHGYREANWTTMSFCRGGQDCASNRVYLHPLQPDINPNS